MLISVGIGIAIFHISAGVWQIYVEDREPDHVTVDPESLAPYDKTTFNNTTYLNESEINRYEILKDHLPSVRYRQVLLIRYVNVTIEFADEEDILPVMDNQPDTFRLWIADGGGVLNNTTEATSYHNTSACHVQWGLENAWIVVGNERDVEFKDHEVVWFDSIESLVTAVEMVEAGDQKYKPFGDL